MTAKRPGRCIERLRDEHGLLEVYETVDARRLYFGNHVAQTELFRFAPDLLSFSYYRAMACAFAFVPQPAQVALLGLGGGALARLVLGHTSARLTAMELRPAVVDLAERHFGVPVGHPGLSLLIGDVRERVIDLAPGQDIVLVDLFDADGMVALDEAFFAALRQRLVADGVMAVNLWRTRLTEFGQQCSAISRSFSHAPLAIHLPDRDNTVLIFGPKDLRRARFEAAGQSLRELPEFIRAPVEEMWPMIR
ncbi:MAG: hypothetical protein ACLFQH_00520 [Halothiobacillaceae bacterium]